ncbi:MAG: PD40 domain-containing protein [Fimbriimonadaceae bacterium]|nr:PD40 domain-containing protein [Fimbriimonadaceae bacterium]
MSRRRWLPPLLLLLALGVAATQRRVGLPLDSAAPEVCGSAPLQPPYSGGVLPPNIAPLHWDLAGVRQEVRAELAGAAGRPLRLATRRGTLRWPAGAWRRLLEANRGGHLTLRLYLRGSEGWQRYQTVQLPVASEPCDPYLVYRKLRPLHNTFGSLGIFERQLSSFRERPILLSRQMDNGCANCHFSQGPQTNRFLLGIRSDTFGSGTILGVDGQATKLATRLGYPTWHPSGQLFCCTVNKVVQWFHPAAQESREVLDLSSSLAYYRLGQEQLETIPAFSAKDRLLTFATWSPDGRWLYYCATKTPWKPTRVAPPEHYDQLRFSLERISYDLASNTWGRPEVVLSAQQAGGSLLQPKVAPDGRRLVFTICDYGAFPIHRPEADLAVVDLATRRWRRLRINSSTADTWHSFSSNGRWLVFSSKRLNGLFVKPYLAYLDAAGEEHEPLLLPERTPAVHQTLTLSYNLPEFAAQPVPYTNRELGELVRESKGVDVPLPAPLRPKDASPGAAAANAR